MKNFTLKNVALVTALSLALAGCGGGSAGSTAPTTSPQTPIVTPTTPGLGSTQEPIVAPASSPVVSSPGVSDSPSAPPAPVFTPISVPSTCVFDTSITVGDYTVSSDPWGVRNQLRTGVLTYTNNITNPVATLYVGGNTNNSITTSAGTFYAPNGYQFQPSDLQTTLPATPDMYQTCISAATTGTTVQTGATASWNWNFGNLDLTASWGLSGYPEIGWTPGGKNITPIATNSNYNLTVTYNITPSTSGNVLLESWIGTNPVDDGNCPACNNPSAEIGIKLYGETASCGINTCSTTIVDGYEFAVVVRDDTVSNTNGTSRYFVQFIATGNNTNPAPILNTTIHMKPFIDWAIGHGYLAMNGTYVKSVELGTELGVGSTDTVTINGFSVSNN